MLRLGAATTQLEESKMNESLPIAAFKRQIVDAVVGNPVVIITAQTGAGKSTQVPQFLLEEGYSIVVTQPRRLAARTVAARVAEEVGSEFGGLVGFRTAYERQDSLETECLFCTDGLALVRELVGAGRHQILVLDEVHEWNINIEVLLAWAKRQIESGANFKLVVMSATLEAEKLAEFFGGAPIIEVPGRLFPVEEKPAGNDSLEGDVAELLRNGRNVLVFQPGKAEIAATTAWLQAANVNAEVLPLHGELTPEEQAACFRRYGRPKCVVATNVAQTSVTIDDIDAVVDSGMERRTELVDGVEGLYLKPISYADREQRKGRAGRCKAGVYVDWCPSADRLDFPKAEILRSRLDQTVLRLQVKAGIDAEELDFFHQPNKAEIHDAKRALKALGCMEENGTVTTVGRRVADLPVSVQFARMVIEAEKLGVVDDVISVAAILEQGEITARPKDRYDVPAWRELVKGEKESDVLAQLTVYKAALNMNAATMRENGIFAKAFFQAAEKRKHLAQALRGKVRFGSNGKRENILRAVCAGMVDHLFQGSWGIYQNGDGVGRELNRDSVVETTNWVVGLPFDLEIKTRRGGKMTLRLIRMVSKVDPSWLVEIAPQLAKEEHGLAPRYEPSIDSVASTTKVYFNGQLVQTVDNNVDPNHPEAANIFCAWLASQMA